MNTTSRQEAAKFVLDALRIARESGHITREHASVVEDALRIQWSNNMTSTMGSASYSGTIKFSSVLYERASLAERRQTAFHETAHLLCNVKYGHRCGHDARWKAMMRVLGCEPQRCHSVPVVHRRSTRTVRAVCRCSEHMLTPKKASQIAQLRCRRCKCLLRLI